MKSSGDGRTCTVACARERAIGHQALQPGRTGATPACGSWAPKPAWKCWTEGTGWACSASQPGRNPRSWSKSGWDRPGPSLPVAAADGTGPEPAANCWTRTILPKGPLPNPFKLTVRCPIATARPWRSGKATNLSPAWRVHLHRISTPRCNSIAPALPARLARDRERLLANWPPDSLRCPGGWPPSSPAAIDFVRRAFAAAAAQPRLRRIAWRGAARNRRRGRAARPVPCLDDVGSGRGRRSDRPSMVSDDGR